MGLDYSYSVVAAGYHHPLWRCAHGPGRADRRAPGGAPGSTNCALIAGDMVGCIGVSEAALAPTSPG